MTRLCAPLTAKNPDGKLRVLLPGRVSSIGQDIANIDASFRPSEDLLAREFKGEVICKRTGEQASGLLADRPTFLELEADVESGEYDLVMPEDLSRVHRNPRFQYAFVQNCVDFGVRVISLGDSLDTADPNWEVALGTAALRHGLHIPDLRRRLKRTASHNFHLGGLPIRFQFGFIKLSKEDAAAGKYGLKGLRLRKNSELTPILHEMRMRVLRNDSYESIADWLNDERIPPGFYSRTGLWTGKLVVGTLRNPMLSGDRLYPKVLHDRVFGSGKPKRKRNPNPEHEHYLELAHFTREEHDELLAFMNKKGDPHRIKGENPRRSVPRSNSPWPGQQMTCEACGSLLHRTANDRLKCLNAFRRSRTPCWNHVMVDAEQVRLKVLPWILSKLRERPDAWKAFLDAAWQEFGRQIRRSMKSIESFDQAIRKEELRGENLSKAIAEGGNLTALVNELKKSQTDLNKLQKQRSKAEDNLRSEKSAPC